MSHIIRRDARTLTLLGHDVWNPGVFSNDTITGMAVSGEHNRLVLTSESGKIIFLNSTTGQLIDGLDFSSAVKDIKHVWTGPVIDGDNVFAIFGASKDGFDSAAVLAFDVRTGAKRGIAPLKAMPHGQLFAAQGALYFATHSSDNKDAPLEANAIHSVHFGKEYALDLDGTDSNIITMLDDNKVLDPEGPLADGEHGISSGNFTLEAWVNTPGVGGQVLYSYGLTRDSREAGFSLTVSESGDVVTAFTTHSSRYEYTAGGTPVADGRWHHVAAVYRQDAGDSAPRCLIYVDGRQQDSTQAKRIDDTFHITSDTRSVVIGGTTGHRFRGMLADIRIWGTWLRADEIATRRSVRLLGDEPELMASWSFRDGGVHDWSHNAFHASVSEKGAVPAVLTNLYFDKPHYPFLQATCTPNGPPTRKQNQDGTYSIAEAVYTATISARTADGSYWPQATTITVLTDQAVKIHGFGLPGKASSESDLQPNIPRQFLTDDRGNLKFTLTCTDIEHVPELKIRAEFMHTNEWMHTCTAVPTQKLVTLPPPKLTAQCDMLEDFHYDHNDPVGTFKKGDDPSDNLHDDTRIATIKTTIVATDSDGSPMAFQPIEVKAEDRLVIEVGGESVTVDAKSVHTFETGTNGQLVITLHEDANSGKADSPGNLLTVPNLLVRPHFMSGFMVIDPVEHVQNSLRAVEPDQLTGKTPLRDGDVQSKPLLRDGKEQHAEAVASTVRHFMEMTKKPARNDSQMAGMANGKPLHSGAMRLHGHLAPADTVRATFHHEHVERHMPICLDHMDEPHFVLHLNDFGKSGNGGAIQYESFSSTKKLDAHLTRNGLGTMGSLLANYSTNGPDDPAGFSIGGLAGGLAHAATHPSETLHEATHVIVQQGGALASAAVSAAGAVAGAIVDTAKAGWDSVKSGAEALAGAVLTVVQKFENEIKVIGTYVIKTVGEVVGHVVDFLVEVAGKLKDIYDFVKSLFNWKQILEVHDVLKDLVAVCVKRIKSKLKQDIPKAIKSLADTANGKVDEIVETFKGHGQRSSLGSLGQAKDEKASGITSHSKSNKSQDMKRKVEHHSQGSAEPTTKAVAHDKVPEMDYDPDLGERAKAVGKDVLDIIMSMGSPAHITLDPFIDLMGGILHFVIDAAQWTVLKAVSLLDLFFEGIEDFLTTKWDIPFVGSLYKSLTGNDLSILDVSCLVMAVPVTVVLNVMRPITGFDWDKEKESVRNGAKSELAAERRRSDAAGAGDKYSLAGFCSIAWTALIALWAIAKIGNDTLAGYNSVTPTLETAEVEKTKDVTEDVQKTREITEEVTTQDILPMRKGITINGRLIRPMPATVVTTTKTVKRTETYTERVTRQEKYKVTEVTKSGGRAADYLSKWQTVKSFTNPLFILGLIEFALAVVAFIAQAIYRSELGEDVISVDNGVGVGAAVVALALFGVGTAEVFEKQVPFKLTYWLPFMAPILAVCSIGAVILACKAPTDVGHFFGQKEFDRGELLISLIAGAVGLISGLLMIKHVNAKSMELTQAAGLPATPLPALFSAGLSAGSVVAFVALHWSMGHGRKWAKEI